MTRRHLVGALLVWAWALAGCSNGNQGAVSVRWRIVDQSSGVSHDPRTLGNNKSGACFLCIGGEGVRDCPDPATQEWWVDQVELTIVDTATNQQVPIEPFPCKDRERTTPFTIPQGRYALSLRADRLTTPAYCEKDCSRQWPTPPPAIRDIKPAEITNLDVIEVLVESPAGQ
jgi:hypothetical protein